MLREIHEHVVAELQQAARVDTVFVVTAVIFNLVVMGINWGVASEQGEAGYPPENDFILVLLIVATLLVNTFAVRALLAGSDTRRKLLNGLVLMYQDNQVDKYYDTSLLDTYGTRYKLFVAVLAILAGLAIVLPLIERLVG